MSHLSTEAKESIVLKALTRGKESIESVARSNNVGVSTLQKWLRRYREGTPFRNRTSRTASVAELSHQTRFNHVLATHHLDGVSLGKYCREHGLYSHQLTEWRESFMQEPQSNKDQQPQSELKKLKEENKRLHRELRRKEKALAEASALLILEKKRT